MSANDLKLYSKAIAKRIPSIRPLIERTSPLNITLPYWESINEAVLYAVIGQMLSKKAAFSIINRLIKYCGNPEKVITWANNNYKREGPIRGVSQRKRKALASWNDCYSSINDISAIWHNMPSNVVRKEIKKIWGFGNWATDMILIFHLSKFDVWPMNDLALNNATKKVFEGKSIATVLKKIKGIETVLALHMWKLLDEKII